MFIWSLSSLPKLVISATRGWDPNVLSDIWNAYWVMPYHKTKSTGGYTSYTYNWGVDEQQILSHSTLGRAKMFCGEYWTTLWLYLNSNVTSAKPPKPAVCAATMLARITEVNDTMPIIHVQKILYYGTCSVFPYQKIPKSIQYPSLEQTEVTLSDIQVQVVRNRSIHLRIDKIPVSGSQVPYFGLKNYSIRCHPHPHHILEDYRNLKSLPPCFASFRSNYFELIPPLLCSGIQGTKRYSYWKYFAFVLRCHEEMIAERNSFIQA